MSRNSSDRDESPPRFSGPSSQEVPCACVSRAALPCWPRLPSGETRATAYRSPWHARIASHDLLNGNPVQRSARYDCDPFSTFFRVCSGFDAPHDYPGVRITSDKNRPASHVAPLRFGHVRHARIAALRRIASPSESAYFLVKWSARR